MTIWHEKLSRIILRIKNMNTAGTVGDGRTCIVHWHSKINATNFGIPSRNPQILKLLLYAAIVASCGARYRMITSPTKLNLMLSLM